MYTAYTLTEESVQRLLDTFPPKFSRVVAHHITEKFGVKKSEPVPQNMLFAVYGYLCGDGIETVLVSQVEGTHLRPDGQHYHVTLSLDPSKGVKPEHSNDLIANNIDNYEKVPLVYLDTIGQVLY